MYQRQKGETTTTNMELNKADQSIENEPEMEEKRRKRRKNSDLFVWRKKVQVEIGQDHFRTRK